MDVTRQEETLAGSGVASAGELPIGSPPSSGSGPRKRPTPEHSCGGLGKRHRSRGALASRRREWTSEGIESSSEDASFAFERSASSSVSDGDASVSNRAVSPRNTAAPEIPETPPPSTIGGRPGSHAGDMSSDHSTSGIALKPRALGDRAETSAAGDRPLRDPADPPGPAGAHARTPAAGETARADDRATEERSADEKAKGIERRSAGAADEAALAASSGGPGRKPAATAVAPTSRLRPGEPRAEGGPARGRSLQTTKDVEIRVSAALAAAFRQLVMRVHTLERRLRSKDRREGSGEAPNPSRAGEQGESREAARARSPVARQAPNAAQTTVDEVGGCSSATGSPTAATGSPVAVASLPARSPVFVPAAPPLGRSAPLLSEPRPHPRGVPLFMSPTPRAAVAASSYPHATQGVQPPKHHPQTDWQADDRAPQGSLGPQAPHGPRAAYGPQAAHGSHTAFGTPSADCSHSPALTLAPAASPLSVVPMLQMAPQPALRLVRPTRLEASAGHGLRLCSASASAMLRAAGDARAIAAGKQHESASDDSGFGASGDLSPPASSRGASQGGQRERPRLGGLDSETSGLRISRPGVWPSRSAQDLFPAPSLAEGIGPGPVAGTGPGSTAGGPPSAQLPPSSHVGAPPLGLARGPRVLDLGSRGPRGNVEEGTGASYRRTPDEDMPTGASSLGGATCPRHGAASASSDDRLSAPPTRPETCAPLFATPLSSEEALSLAAKAKAMMHAKKERDERDEARRAARRAARGGTKPALVKGGAKSTNKSEALMQRAVQGAATREAGAWGRCADRAADGSSSGPASASASPAPAPASPRSPMPHGPLEAASSHQLPPRPVAVGRRQLRRDRSPASCPQHRAPLGAPFPGLSRPSSHSTSAQGQVASVSRSPAGSPSLSPLPAGLGAPAPLRPASHQTPPISPSLSSPVPSPILSPQASWQPCSASPREHSLARPGPACSQQQPWPLPRGAVEGEGRGPEGEDVLAASLGQFSSRDSPAAPFPTECGSPRRADAAWTARFGEAIPATRAAGAGALPRLAQSAASEARVWKICGAAQDAPPRPDQAEREKRAGAFAAARCVPVPPAEGSGESASPPADSPLSTLTAAPAASMLGAQTTGTLPSACHLSDVRDVRETGDVGDVGDVGSDRKVALDGAAPTAEEDGALGLSDVPRAAPDHVLATSAPNAAFDRTDAEELASPTPFSAPPRIDSSKSDDPRMTLTLLLTAISQELASASAGATS